VHILAAELCTFYLPNRVHHIGDRPTVDIDLLGRHMATSDVADVIREIVSVPLDVDDGVVFDPGSVQAKRITGQTKYEGMRVLVDCYPEQARQIAQRESCCSHHTDPSQQHDPSAH